MVIAELSIFPLGKGQGVSPYVARALDIIAASGLAYELHPMGTCIEGEWDRVMAVVSDCFAALSSDCDRVYLNLKVDWRKGRTARMRAKVDSVRNKMERP